MKHANDNLDPIVNTALEWAVTIPADQSIVRHPDFPKYCEHLTDEQFEQLIDGLEKRAAFYMECAQ